jgi:hypothetical protein
VFHVLEEVTIGSLKIGVGGMSLREGILMLVVECLAIIVILLVHNVGVRFWGRGEGLEGKHLVEVG